MHALSYGKWHLFCSKIIIITIFIFIWKHKETVLPSAGSLHEFRRHLRLSQTEASSMEATRTQVPEPNLLLPRHALVPVLWAVPFSERTQGGEWWGSLTSSHCFLASSFTTSHVCPSSLQQLQSRARPLLAPPPAASREEGQSSTLPRVCQDGQLWPEKLSGSVQHVHPYRIKLLLSVFPIPFD